MNQETPKDSYEGTTELTAALLAELETAHLGLRALLPRLDPAIWNRRDVCDALQALLLRHDRVEVQLCLLENAEVRRDNPRLLALADRLPSRLALRQADRQHADITESFLLFDDRRYLRRANPIERRWATDRALPNQAPRLAALFQSVWERGISHPDLRSVVI